MSESLLYIYRSRLQIALNCNFNLLSMTIDNQVNHIIAEIAQKLNLPYEKVKHACLFQFKRLEEVIDEGEEDMRLPYLGKFLNWKKMKRKKRR